jgi:hypothetical protein
MAAASERRLKTIFVNAPRYAIPKGAPEGEGVLLHSAERGRCGRESCRIAAPARSISRIGIARAKLLASVCGHGTVVSSHSASRELMDERGLGSWRATARVQRKTSLDVSFAFLHFISAFETDSFPLGFASFTTASNASLRFSCAIIPDWDSRLMAAISFRTCGTI